MRLFHSLFFYSYHTFLKPSEKNILAITDKEALQISYQQQEEHIERIKKLQEQQAEHIEITKNIQERLKESQDIQELNNPGLIKEYPTRYNESIIGDPKVVEEFMLILFRKDKLGIISPLFLIQRGTTDLYLSRYKNASLSEYITQLTSNITDLITQLQGIEVGLPHAFVALRFFYRMTIYTIISMYLYYILNTSGKDYILGKYP
jgi:hypothetical protein